MRDYALVGGRFCTGLVDSTSDLSALDSEGFWAVVVPFDGSPVCARFSQVGPIPRTAPSRTHRQWHGIDPSAWSTSLDKVTFMAGVERIRSEIAAGNVYQVNLTRRLRTKVPEHQNIGYLGTILRRVNPAPFEAVISSDTLGLQIASASPELFVARDGSRIRSSPIKGTAATEDGFLAKDTAENVMIVDLVRNDFGRICDWGSVTVPELLITERHPGLYHLVSTVEGTLRQGFGWTEILAATFPPGSVTGAPKLAALDLIGDLEPEARGQYCGAIGWVDADHQQGELNVAIRTFWIEDGELNLGTGGGITYDSSPEGEWFETELKTSRLLHAASRLS